MSDTSRRTRRRMYQRLAAALLPAMLDAGYFAPNTLLIRCYGQF